MKRSRKQPPAPVRLNAVGKPLSPLFDPKWKRKMPLTSIRRLLVPYRPGTMRWVHEREDA